MSDETPKDPLEEVIRQSGKWKDGGLPGTSDAVDRGLRYSESGGSGSATLPVDTTPEIEAPVEGPPVNPVFDNAGPGQDLRDPYTPGPYKPRDWEDVIDASTAVGSGKSEHGLTPAERSDDYGLPELDRQGVDPSALPMPPMYGGSIPLREDATPLEKQQIARQAQEPHGITKAAEATAGTGTSKPPARSAAAAPVPRSVSPSTSASSGRRETGEGSAMSDSTPTDREAEMAKRNAEINARVKAGAPVKPWNPVIIAKRAKSMSTKAKQIAAAAGLAAVLAGLGVCVSAATRPQVDPADAAKPAPAPTVLIDLQRGLVPQTPTPRPTATPAPVDATVTVTVAYTFAGANCPADLRSREHRLGTETVSNPAPGLTRVTNFGSMTFPKFCTPTLVVEGARQSALAPNVIFRPRTTFEVRETKDDVCLNPSTRVCTIRVDLFVTNEAR